MRSLLLCGLLALSTVASAATSTPERLWVTVDADGLALLQRIDPALRATAQRTAPMRSSSITEPRTIYAVEVDPAQRDALAAAMHRDEGHCAGFTAHESLDAALAALDPAPLAFVPTRPDYVIDQSMRVLPILAALSETRIGEDIQTLSAFHNRYYDSQYGADAADWLADTWLSIAQGRNDIHVQKVRRGSDRMPSVVLTIDGDTLDSQVLVMGAHLDSINWSDAELPLAQRRAPGADDDASGVATITEVLRAIVATDFHPRRQVQLMAYSGEELGLYGSTYIAFDYASRQVDVVGMLQMDMTNYNLQTPDIDIVIIDDYTDAQQNQFLVDLATHYLPDLNVAHSVCGYSCSDHSSWTSVGYAASFPFEAPMGQDNPYIHLASDTWANSGSQSAHALKFAQLAAAWLVELGLDEDRIFANGFESGTSVFNPD